MKILLALLAISCPLFCQVKLPNWGGAGAMFSNPGWSGIAALAVPVSNSAGLYSFTLYQESLLHGKLATTTSTGLDEIVRTVVTKHGTFMLHGILTFGATTTSSATTGSFPYGGGGTFAFKGWAPGLFVIKNATAHPSAVIVIGRTW